MRMIDEDEVELKDTSQKTHKNETRKKKYINFTIIKKLQIGNG